MRQAIPGRLLLEPFTPKTLTTLDALEVNLAGTAGRGFAIDDEERNIGLRCVAAASAVLEATSRITLAIGGSAPQPAG